MRSVQFGCCQVEIGKTTTWVCILVLLSHPEEVICLILRISKLSEVVEECLAHL